MIESDHSDSETGDMDKLHLSSDSADAMTTKKRPRIENSEDEATDLLTKKWCSSSSDQSEILKKDNTEVISDKSDTDNSDTNEKKHTLYPENRSSMHEKSPSESNMENKKKQDNVSVKQENGNQSPLNRNDSIMNEDTVEVNVKENIENEDSPSKKLVTDTNATTTFKSEKAEKDNETIEEEVNEEIEKKEESEEDDMKKERISKNRNVDTEVVDGLELSVECASDKEEPSSESEDEKDVKPRPRTIIVKAKPNESELECSSSEGEKSDLQEATDTLETKSEKRRGRKRGPRTSFSKLKTSGSEDSQNNNSDEDYSPRTKKKMKKSPTTRKPTKRSTESKRGRGGGVRRNSRKKSTEPISDDEDEDVTSVEKIDKAMKTKNGMEEELSEKGSLASESESDNNSEDETKSRRSRRNSRPEDNKHIQRLKKYLSIAGVRVKSYNDVWSDCKTNAARIRRLKELLEKNGITGRPTLEKCKRAKEKKQRMKEISELDVSNIISEGRVTRARRNMDNDKKAIPPDTPPRHREVRNTFKRIQTVIDSDSE